MHITARKISDREVITFPFKKEGERELELRSFSESRRLNDAPQLVIRLDKLGDEFQILNREFGLGVPPAAKRGKSPLIATPPPHHVDIPDNLRGAFKQQARYIGAGNTLTIILYPHTIEPTGKMSPPYPAKDLFGAIRTLVNWLHEKECISMVNKIEAVDYLREKAAELSRGE